MNVALVINKKIPAVKYGGTSRVVSWLSRALVSLGHKVFILCSKGSRSDSGEVIGMNSLKDLPRVLPHEVDIVHLHTTGFPPISKPHLLTSHWVTPSTEEFPKNHVFLSKAHAMRYGSSHFVYNGLDPDEYLYSEEKDDYFLFLSKISRSSKGLDRAIELARRTGIKLIVAGGWKLSFNKKIRFVGEVGGRKKAELLAHAKGFIFPISWGEPFGLVTIEAMVSGTPVISTPFGAVPEIVTKDTGFICKDQQEMECAVERTSEIKPCNCRNHVLSKFTSEYMARSYLRYYQKILETGSIGC